MEPMFIDFRGHVIKIIEKDGKNVAVMSNQEELASNAADLILLDQDPEALTENVYNQMFNKVFDDIKKDWEKDLRKSVLHILGFSDSWGRMQVDHCNGRMSTVGDLISTEAKKLMMEQLDPKALTLTEEERKELSKATKKDLLERFNYQYSQAFYREAERLIQDYAKEDAKKQLEDILKNKKGDGLDAVRLMNFRFNNPR